MRRLAVAAILVLAFQPAPPIVDVRVQRVVDGDTFVTRSGARVRLLGVDTPETVHPTKPIQCFGPEASAFAERHLEGDRVGLEFDVEMTDHYGRTLAWVHDRRFARTFNWVLVRRGFARIRYYSPNWGYHAELVAAQRKAKAERRGLWGACA